MSPKITITKGERQVEIQVDDSVAQVAGRAILNDVYFHLGDYSFRLSERTNPEKSLVHQLMELGQKLEEAGKETS